VVNTYTYGEGGQPNSTQLKKKEVIAWHNLLRSAFFCPICQDPKIYSYICQTNELKWLVWRKWPFSELLMRFDPCFLPSFIVSYIELSLSEWMTCTNHLDRKHPEQNFTNGHGVWLWIWGSAGVEPRHLGQPLTLGCHKIHKKKYFRPEFKSV